eukprot:scaffold536055_cov20-Prasinocladus_malaysianus.AAC.1
MLHALNDGSKPLCSSWRERMFACGMDYLAKLLLPVVVCPALCNQLKFRHLYLGATTQPNTWRGQIKLDEAYESML